MTHSWQGIVTLAVVAAASLGSLALGNTDLALLFGGAAAGLLGPQPVRRQ